MELLGKAKEALRDKTRDDLCSAFQSIGIQTQSSERGRLEEEIKRAESLGLIDVFESPISWINVCRERGHGGTYYHFILGVPDTRITSNSSKLKVKSFYQRTFPILGSVVETRWKGNDMSSGLIERLNGDLSLAYGNALADNIAIRTNYKHSCWLIYVYNELYILKKNPADWGSLWQCWQTIAQHLLDTRIVSHGPVIR